MLFSSFEGSHSSALVLPAFSPEVLHGPAQLEAASSNKLLNITTEGLSGKEAGREGRSLFALK